jgi:hypothetical protein
VNRFLVGPHHQVVRGQPRAAGGGGSHGDYIFMLPLSTARATVTRALSPRAQQGTLSDGMAERYIKSVEHLTDWTRGCISSSLLTGNSGTTQRAWPQLT